MASTSRYFDQSENEFKDGKTEWFTVKVFRGAAITVASSIHKGQPVTVYGRFRTSEWEGEGGTRTDLVIDATSVGHDLTRGYGDFVRVHGEPLPSTEADVEADSETSPEWEPVAIPGASPAL